MKRTDKKIIKILESNGFDVTRESDEQQWFIHQYTPAGEDWGFYLENLDDLVDYAENFDPDDEFEMWVEAKKNGTRGVPSYSELFEDQLWKQNILKEVADFI